MKKNISGQVIGAQLITAADGTAFTGAVSVFHTVDGGTQTSGGGTAPTHEGNGFHTYMPLQVETNGDHVAFTFTGTGAIPATIQVYTNTPQSEDNATKLADVPTVAEFEARTLIAANYFDPAVDIVANVTLVDTTTSNTDMRGTNSALLAANYIAPDNTGITAANNSVQISALNDVTAAEVADAVWDEALAGHTTAGTFGLMLDVPVSSVSGGGGITAEDVRIEMDDNSTKLASIVADTNELQGNQGDWATATGFSTFNPSTDVVANVTLVDTTTSNTDMRGTDGANTVTPATAAQLNARTLLAADYFDPAVDPVANVSLVDTTTNNTDMRGTNNALLNSSYTSPDNAGIAQTQVDIAALNDISVSDILNTTMTESYAADGSEATLAQGIYNIQQNLCEFSYVGTTKTTKKLNGTSTAATYTLDDSVNPSSMIRSS